MKFDNRCRGVVELALKSKEEEFTARRSLFLYNLTISHTVVPYNYIPRLFCFINS
jgi:hypothetical protein